VRRFCNTYDEQNGAIPNKIAFEALVYNPARSMDILRAQDRQLTSDAIESIPTKAAKIYGDGREVFPRRSNSGEMAYVIQNKYSRR